MYRDRDDAAKRRVDKWNERYALMEINEESGDTSLKVGEKKILKVPFAMYSYQFQPKDWEKIEEREFVWVLTGAPVKNMILLNGE